ncbi:MAG: hypothetical protein LBK95_17830, partial [Bifidobacteriaceae bacterium]|jgi:ABC-type uncharacterized transport system ATPase subunit|nr:hypothetical protein [Bifidobacteriaceae bacterium]
VLLSTHLLEDVRAVAAQVVILAQGQIVFAGAPDELAATPADSPDFAASFDAAATSLMAVDE